VTLANKQCRNHNESDRDADIGELNGPRDELMQAFSVAAQQF
jgi:hypothetical protein